MSCGICARTGEIGAWHGLGGKSHCGDAPRAGVVGCHRTWPGTHQAHCVGCHRHFTSDGAAMLHHGPSGCLDPATLRTRDGAPRLVLRESTEYGPIWGYPSPDEDASGLPREPRGTPVTADRAAT